ncbi:CLUMA_CG013512, isoform A [Clunio marinus]|uniref:CLUMA_CG013512, isoform A n=1 Tax=Clunio marinus TaxID=568069 RepID=A0A1J1IJ19_9DIPT|nr:CLUMA_CG013512, isoform A [Clunio marinus]
MLQSSIKIIYTMQARIVLSQTSWEFLCCTFKNFNDKNSSLKISMNRIFNVVTVITYDPIN